MNNMLEKSYKNYMKILKMIIKNRVNMLKNMIIYCLKNA